MSYHQTIYNLLRGYGLSEAGALGMLGNWECESGCEPYRVQGDYQPSRAISKAYVEAIETHRMSKEQFATDQKGAFLAQWTYPQRKRNLWDAWQKSSLRIDSCELQVAFAMWELQNEYSGLLNYLRTAEAIYDCTNRICREYERPAVNNVQARYEAALRIRQEINLDGEDTPVDPIESGEEEQPKIETWPPRTIDNHCSGWPEVWLLQSLLKCHNYNVTVDGMFGADLINKTIMFQKDNGLDPDGIVGNATWAKLMERG